MFCYGGRQEIVSAVKKIIGQVKNGTFNEKDLTPELFEQFLWTGTIPSPDLIIRTGGAQRLSNFLLWQFAYSEIYVTDVLWPDFSLQELQRAVRSYHQRTKNLGA